MNLPFTIIDNKLLVGRHTTISFNRTLRVPEDGKKYNLPAGFGKLPIIPVDDVKGRVPEKWREKGGLIIPLYQREALFLEFGGVRWRPTISKVAVGGINAVTGANYDKLLQGGRQDYIVIPEQRWLDGVYSEKGTVKQFVAMPLGLGYTVEAQVTDEEKTGGFQIVAFDPKDGIFSEPKAPEYSITNALIDDSIRFSLPVNNPLPPGRGLGGHYFDKIEMGLGAGGSIKQQIFEDTHGIDVWDENSSSEISVYIVNSLVFESLTGFKPPESPISQATYAKLGFPWFSNYDETKRVISAPKVFRNILGVLQIDRTRGNKVENQKEKIINERIIKIATPTIVLLQTEMEKRVKAAKEWAQYGARHEKQPT
jgi:hypothetical protein